MSVEDFLTGDLETIRNQVLVAGIYLKNQNYHGHKSLRVKLTEGGGQRRLQSSRPDRIWHEL